MSNPVLIDVTRGSAVESQHRGAFALLDGAGRVVAATGDIDQLVYPRSAVKALQTLPLVENGWADRYGLTEAELTLACASHTGEPIHTDTAAGMLAKLGLGESDLECGAHWPTSKQVIATLNRDGRSPTALHNNCSGKHAGFLCAACALEADPKGYVRPDHPVQIRIRDTMSEIYDLDLRNAPSGTDGCSIPTYAVPLRSLAQAFARFGTGERWASDRAAAAKRLREAVASHPVLVRGTGGLDTDLAARFGTRVFTKTGAEGVFCAALPDRGWGLAIKCDDGASRAAEAVLLAILERAMAWTEADHDALAHALDPVMRNWNGIPVGKIQPSPAFEVALSGVA